MAISPVAYIFRRMPLRTTATLLPAKCLEVAKGVGKMCTIPSLKASWDSIKLVDFSPRKSGDRNCYLQTSA